MKKQSILFVAVALMATACSTETYEFAHEENMRVQASFTGHINATRAIANQWEDGDEIGIFMKRQGESLADASLVDDAFNRKYLAAADGRLTPATELDNLYYPTTGTVDFIAYYPFANVHDYSVMLNVSNQRNHAAIDFLYSQNLTEISSSSESQNLVFDHQLSKIYFHFTLADDMPANSLEGACLTFKNTVYEGSFNLSTGVLVSSTSVRDISIDVDAASAAAEAIFIPQPCDDIEVVLSLTSGKYYLFDFIQEHEWESGNQYSYEVTLKADDNIETTLEAEITAWTDNDASGSLQESDIEPWDGSTIRTSWYAPDKEVMDMVYPEDLAGLAQLVNSGVSFEGKTLRLTHSLDMNNHEWTPIGTLNHPFKGTFEGNNHRITNIHPSSVSTRYVGLFGFSAGTIQHLIVTGACDVASPDVDNAIEYLFNVGGLCGMSNGTISHCRSYVSVKGTIAQTTDELQTNIYVGGMAGQNTGIITDCQNYGLVEAVNPNTGVNAYIHIGGIVGSNTGQISNCDNTRNLIANGGNVRAGGISGLSSGENTTVNSCINLGDITVPVSHNEVSVGGIVGKQAKKSSLADVINKGKINSILTAGETIMGGGLVGQNDGAYIHSGVNYATVSVQGCGNSDKAVAGGLVGFNMNQASVHLGQNEGEISATGGAENYSGGIAGYNNFNTEDEENAEGYIYSCCQNLGIPAMWVGNTSDANSQITTCDSTSH